MKKRLTSFLHTFHLIDISQHGFCATKSTETALVETVILEKFNENFEMLGYNAMIILHLPKKEWRKGNNFNMLLRNTNGQQLKLKIDLKKIKT